MVENRFCTQFLKGAWHARLGAGVQVGANMGRETSQQDAQDTLSSKALAGGIDSRGRRHPRGITAVLKGNNHQS